MGLIFHKNFCRISHKEFVDHLLWGRRGEFVCVHHEQNHFAHGAVIEVGSGLGGVGPNVLVSGSDAVLEAS